MSYATFRYRRGAQWRLYQPERHRPIQACDTCGHPWPCDTEQRRVEARRAAAEAVARAREAAAFARGYTAPASQPGQDS